ncbi:MAG: 1-acyl-sn-glycerol-3-phosphate acyltransferase [Lachnospiraceae bacterium]|nr:1-acyl-sn-glycerol-3-phosphate acyltransferase [Lachnospiraceae bacterium]
MKIKTKTLSYEEVIALPHAHIRNPRKPSPILRALIKFLASSELKKADFSVNVGDMKGVGEKQPALYLMNHSCFTDLMIASHVIKGPYNIVATTDAFVGKESLMRAIGCISTRKFRPDIKLIKDISYAITELKTSVLMFPEAGYSFDGTTTTLPDSLGKMIKLSGYPVVMILSHGAFLHDPLYNGLRLRKCKITADKYTLFSTEEIKELTADQINEKIREAFSFDNLKEQFETGTCITESTRAEGLSRVLYKCPVCGKEGRMRASGTEIKCEECGSTWELTELGKMEFKGQIPEKTVSPKLFDHIPDWFGWERSCVRQELEDGTYSLDVPVHIYMIVDNKAFYEVGDGRLTHSEEGFHLTGCDGKLDFIQKPLASYSVNSDYFFYEIGDMISIGDNNELFYCFPPEEFDVVAKTRLAAEELYKIKKNHR